MTYKGFFSPKNPKKYKGDPTNIIYRSSWEKRVMSHLDENEAVVEWSSEETIVPYYDPNTKRTRRYFPDFIATFRLPDGSLKTTMIEVKPKKETMEPKKRKVTRAYVTEVVTWANNSAKWEYARAYCAKRGWNFQILTEDDIFGVKEPKPKRSKNK